jgi:peptidoglycan/xylan/chitin deacetylase (PgdA/CDA1 family)
VENIPQTQPNWVSPENFEFQMNYLKKNGFKVISLDELVESIKSERRLSRKSVVITFDDGYEDNYTNAYPILKKYGFPATIFLVSDSIDTEGFLTADQIVEMHNNRIDFGAHTRTHAYLPDHSREKQLDEIGNSKKILEDKFHFDIDYFAYPNGGFSDDIKSIVQSAGFKGACATNRGFDKFNKDVYELKRVRFSDKDVHLNYLIAKLSGYYNMFRKSKKSH